MADAAAWEPRPRRVLSLPAATSLVMGNVIGIGVFQLPATVAAYGTVGIVAFGVVGVCSVLLAVVLGWLARRLPYTGGPYVYARDAFGELTGFLTAWSYWITCWATNGAVVVAWAGYVNVLVPLHGRGPTLAVTIGALWLAVLANLAGVHRAGRIAMIITIVKFVPLVVIAFAGLFFLQRENFGPFVTHGHNPVGALTSSAAVVMFSFLGIESATVAAEEVREPRRNVMRATVIGTLVAAVVYVAGTISIFGVVPHDKLLRSTAPYADAAATLVHGGWNGADETIAVAAVISGAGTLVGWTLTSARMPYAAARDALFPVMFLQRNRRGVPWVGLVAGGLLASLLTLANYTGRLQAAFTAMALLTTFTATIPYVFSAAAQLLWLLTDHGPRGRPEAMVRFVRDALISAISVGFTIWLVAGAGYTAVYQGVLLLFAAIPVYVLMRWRAARKALDREAEGAGAGADE